jgi:hypothetical protein
MKKKLTHINEDTYTDYLSVYSSQKKSVIKFLNAGLEKIVPYANSAIDTALSGYVEKCYDVNYILSTSTYCFYFWGDINLYTIKITDATFSVPTDYANTGWVKASVSGSVSGRVTLGCKDYGSLGVDVSASFTQTIWLYKFSKLQIFPPVVKISTEKLDLGIVWIWMTDNVLKINNPIVGTYKWPLSIQSEINKCFDKDGGPYRKDISTTEIKKYLTIA